MSYDHERDSAGRIIVPVDGPNVPGNPKRTTLRLGLMGGRRGDTDPTVAPVSDVNNFVMLPDGSGVRVRDGFQFTGFYPIQTSPAGRIAYMVETAPNNVPISFRHMAIPTGNGVPYIYDGEYIRDRSQAIGETPLASISWTQESQVANLSPATTLLQIFRQGAMLHNAAFRYKTRDGTALAASGHYTSTDSSSVSTANGILFVGVTAHAAGSGRYFYVDLYEPGQGVVLINPITMVVSIP